MFDILKKILEADMAICDLSSRNPNVMYELAVRQCFGLPVVLIKDNVTIEPFDSGGIRYVEYDKQLRIDLVEIAINNLRMSIKETEASKNNDVFSLLQILGREEAKVKTSEVNPVLLNVLQQVTNLTNQLNSASPKFRGTSLSPYFFPVEEVTNIIYPSIGTSLKSLGIDRPENLKIGDKVSHRLTGNVGTLIGLGSSGGTGAILVEVDGGPLVAASHSMYEKYVTM